MILLSNLDYFLGGCRLRCGLVVSSVDGEGSEGIEDVSVLAVPLETGEEGGRSSRGSSNVAVEERSESCFVSCAGCTVRGFFEGVGGSFKLLN